MIDEETVRAAEYLLRTGNVAGLVLLPHAPFPENERNYSWEDLVQGIREVRALGLPVQAGVRTPAISPSGSWGIGLYEHLAPSNPYGWGSSQRLYLEDVFIVPPEPSE